MGLKKQGRHQEGRLHDGDIFSVSLLTIEDGIFDADATHCNWAVRSPTHAPFRREHKKGSTANVHAIRRLRTVYGCRVHPLLDFYALEYS